MAYRKFPKSPKKQVKVLKPLVAERQKDVSAVRRYSREQKLTLPESARIAKVVAEREGGEDPSTFRRTFGTTRTRFDNDSLSGQGSKIVRKPRRR